MFSGPEGRSAPAADLSAFPAPYNQTVSPGEDAVSYLCTGYLPPLSRFLFTL
jgi:hypothetical protein